MQISNRFFFDNGRIIEKFIKNTEGVLGNMKIKSNFMNSQKY